MLDLCVHSRAWEGPTSLGIYFTSTALNHLRDRSTNEHIPEHWKKFALCVSHHCNHFSHERAPLESRSCVTTYLFTYRYAIGSTGATSKKAHSAINSTLLQLQSQTSRHMSLPLWHVRACWFAVEAAFQASCIELRRKSALFLVPFDAEKELVSQL